MSNIQIGDMTIYYEIEGNGKPLVLLPGLLGTIDSNWRRFIPPLAKYYRIIAIDLRGHGRTNNPAPSGKLGTGELHIEQLADDLNSLLDTLGFEKVSVLDYSLGGAVGLQAGLKRPGRIMALVMHSTKFFWNEASISAMSAALNPDTIMEKTPRYAQLLQREHAAIYGDKYWRELLDTAVRFINTMPEQGPTIEQATRADFPILVSVGDRDQMVPIDEAIRLVSSLPKGELMVIPATDHPVQHVRPEAFLPVIMDFLDRALKLNNEGN
ncbi:alpha/beta fold hydrolase [Chloroflexota bacterium]